MLPKYSTVLYGSHCTYYSYIYYILMMIKGSCIIRLAGAKYIEYQELRNIAWRGGGGERGRKEGGRGERGRKDNFTVNKGCKKRILSITLKS